MDIDPSARPAPAIPVVGKPPAEAADAAPTTGKTGVRGKRSVAKLAGPGDPAQATARQALHLQKLARLSRFADKKLFANELGVRRRLADLQGKVGSPEFLAQYRQLKVQLKADAARERLSARQPVDARMRGFLKDQIDYARQRMPGGGAPGQAAELTLTHLRFVDGIDRLAGARLQFALQSNLLGPANLADLETLFARKAEAALRDKGLDITNELDVDKVRLEMKAALNEALLAFWPEDVNPLRSNAGSDQRLGEELLAQLQIAAASAEALGLEAPEVKAGLAAGEKFMAQVGTPAFRVSFDYLTRILEFSQSELRKTVGRIGSELRQVQDRLGRAGLDSEATPQLLLPRALAHIGSQDLPTLVQDMAQGIARGRELLKAGVVERTKALVELQQGLHAAGSPDAAVGQVLDDLLAAAAEPDGEGSVAALLASARVLEAGRARLRERIDELGTSLEALHQRLHGLGVDDAAVTRAVQALPDLRRDAASAGAQAIEALAAAVAHGFGLQAQAAREQVPQLASTLKQMHHALLARGVYDGEIAQALKALPGLLREEGEAGLPRACDMLREGIARGLEQQAQALRGVQSSMRAAGLPDAVAAEALAWAAVASPAAAGVRAREAFELLQRTLDEGRQQLRERVRELAASLRDMQRLLRALGIVDPVIAGALKAVPRLLHDAGAPASEVDLEALLRGITRGIERLPLAIGDAGTLLRRLQPALDPQGRAAQAVTQALEAVSVAVDQLGTPAQVQTLDSIARALVLTRRERGAAAAPPARG